jgi:hypothetical protein
MVNAPLYRLVYNTPQHIGRSGIEKFSFGMEAGKELFRRLLEAGLITDEGVIHFIERTKNEQLSAPATRPPGEDPAPS